MGHGCCWFRWGLFEGVWQWWWRLAEAFLGLGSCPGAPERARTFGVAEGCSSLLRFAGVCSSLEYFVGIP
ncbi:hypothetical protein P8452_56927 [Trifolium repens]|nr:hypothetical protein P8452_56927 [Trifolium repens]